MKMKDKQVMPSDAQGIARVVYARWYFGHPARRVVMPERGEEAGSLAGSLIVYEIPFRALNFVDPQFGEWSRCTGIVRAETLLVVLAAGLLDGRSDRSEGQVRAVGGAFVGNDAGAAAVLQRAREVAADWLPGGFDDAWDLATARARAVLTTPNAIAAVCNVASRLAAKKWLEQDDLDGMCLMAFHGRTPSYDAWSQSWPPTLRQLSETHVPLFDDEHEAVKAKAKRSHDLAWYLTTVAPRVLAPVEARS